MDLEETKRLSLELMESSNAVYLSTINPEGYPITRAMVNVRNKDIYPEFIGFFNKQLNPFVIFFSTNTSSSKIDHIRNQSKISAYYCDPKNFKGVLFGGEVKVVESMDIKQEFFLESSIRYYPKGVMDPDYTILELNPKTVNLYYQSEKIEFKLGELK